MLIWLPALAAAQWGARLYGLSARLAAAPPKKRVKITGELLTRVLRKRLAASAFVFGSLALLVGLLCAYELNAVNASLGNFLGAPSSDASSRSSDVTSAAACAGVLLRHLHVPLRRGDGERWSG